MSYGGSKQPNLKRFCIFGSARTGSSYLIAALDKSPDVVCHGEIFHNRRIFIRKKYKDMMDVAILAQRQSAPLLYLAELERASKSHTTQSSHTVTAGKFLKHRASSLFF